MCVFSNDICVLIQLVIRPPAIELNEAMKYLPHHTIIIEEIVTFSHKLVQCLRKMECTNITNVQPRVRMFGAYFSLNKTNKWSYLFMFVIKRNKGDNMRCCKWSVLLSFKIMHLLIVISIKVNRFGIVSYSVAGLWLV